jgi:hypothetical protein
MPRPGRLDDEARAELLCYLVVGQLIAINHAGTWLKTSHLVESARIWLANNGADCDWMERAMLAQISSELAPGVLSRLDLRDATHLAQLFVNGWRLDYRSTTVQRIYGECVRYLRSRRRHEDFRDGEYPLDC